MFFTPRTKIRHALRYASLSALLVGAALALPADAAQASSPSAGEEVSITLPRGRLGGMLLLADAPDAPLVIIHPGSGPTDRDGNSPLGIRAASYQRLAEALRDKGVSTLRVDKRGMFSSRMATADPNAVTIDDYAGDLNAWAKWVRATTGRSCVWVLGHSEGGLSAMAAARDPQFCGVLLVAAPGRRLGEVMREQFRANPMNAPILDSALATLDTLEKGGTVDVTKLHPALAQLFAPAVQPFLIDLLGRDPAAMVAAIDKPVLILNGARDIQVSEADARALAAAKPDATLVILPAVNHVLKRVDSDDRAANIATYSDSSLPIAPEVVEAVAGFVSQPR